MPVNILRLSDNHTYVFKEIEPTDRVYSLKSRIKDDFMPSFPNGCRLKYNGKVLKSRHRLKYYNIEDNCTIEMDDRKNWDSSSSSAESEKE